MSLICEKGLLMLAMLLSREKSVERKRGGSGNAYFVAIPEHLAMTFNATLSPSRRFLVGPVTVATCCLPF